MPLAVSGEAIFGECVHEPTKRTVMELAFLEEHYHIARSTYPAERAARVHVFPWEIGSSDV